MWETRWNFDSPVVSLPLSALAVGTQDEHSSHVPRYSASQVSHWAVVLILIYSAGESSDRIRFHSTQEVVSVDGFGDLDSAMMSAIAHRELGNHPV